MKRKQRRNYLRLMQWRHDHIILLVSCCFPFLYEVSVCVRFHTGFSVLLYLRLFILICPCSMFIEIEYSMSITSTVLLFGITLESCRLYCCSHIDILDMYSNVQYILQWYVCLHYLFVYISVYHINGKLDLDHIDVVFDSILWDVFTHDSIVWHVFTCF